jgi:hypothetical protein
VLAIVGLLAATNLAARERQRRADAGTSDVVAATVVVTVDAMTVRPGSAALTISVSNTGPTLQLRRPRVAASGFRLDPVGRLPSQVATGTTVLARLQLRVICRGETDVPPRLVVPLVPRSGQVHEVTAAVSPDLYALTCGLRSPADSAQPEVDEVFLRPYAVDFRLTVRNTSAHRFRLTGLGGQGLALGAVGGLPVDVAPRGSIALQVHLAIPSCAQLPDPLDEQRIDSLAFGAFELELADEAGRPSSLPYLTDTASDLYRAIRALAHRICPRRAF